jgi:predicted dehydrogenase
MLKVAVIGAGNIGKTHLRCYANHAEAQPVAVCDMAQDKGASPGRAIRSARVWQRRGTAAQRRTRCGERRNRPAFENGSHHFEPTMRVLEAGIPCCAKSRFRNNIEEARQMVAKAREKDVKFGINLNHRFTPAAERLKKLQLDGEFGEVPVHQHGAVVQRWRPAAVSAHSRFAPALD